MDRVEREVVDILREWHSGDAILIGTKKRRKEGSGVLVIWTGDGKGREESLDVIGFL